MFVWKAFRRQRGKHSLIDAVHKVKHPTLFVVLIEDSAAMTGLLVTLIGIVLTDITSYHIFDSISSILIGAILALTADGLLIKPKVC